MCNSILISILLVISAGSSTNFAHSIVPDSEQGLYFLTRPLNDSEEVGQITWQEGKLTDRFGKMYDCQLSFEPQIGFLTTINGATRVVLRDKMMHALYDGQLIYSLNIATDQSVEKYYATCLVAGTSNLYKLYPGTDDTQYFSQMNGEKHAQPLNPRKKDIAKIFKDIPAAAPIIRAVPGSGISEDHLVNVYSSINEIL